MIFIPFIHVGVMYPNPKPLPLLWSISSSLISFNNMVLSPLNRLNFYSSSFQAIIFQYFIHILIFIFFIFQNPLYISFPMSQLIIYFQNLFYLVFPTITYFLRMVFYNTLSASHFFIPKLNIKFSDVFPPLSFTSKNYIILMIL